MTTTDVIMPGSNARPARRANRPSLSNVHKAKAPIAAKPEATDLTVGFLDATSAAPTGRGENSGRRSARKAKTTAPASKADAPAPGEVGDAPVRLTKREQIVALLRRADGASLDELMAATGWLPHTTRAALSGLRKSGMTLEWVKTDGGNCYRIVG